MTVRRLRDAAEYALSYLGFPGVVVHEFAHSLAFKVFDVDHEVVLLDSDSPVAGRPDYVSVLEPPGATAAWTAAVAPFLVGTPIAVGFVALALAIDPPYSWGALYLGFVIGTQAAPSDTDMAMVGDSMETPGVLGSAAFRVVELAFGTLHGVVVGLLFGSVLLSV